MDPVFVLKEVKEENAAHEAHRETPIVRMLGYFLVVPSLLITRIRPENRKQALNDLQVLFSANMILLRIAHKSLSNIAYTPFY